MRANTRIHVRLVPTGRICLFAHGIIWLSSLCRLVRYILSSVCLKLSHLCNIWRCVFSTYPLLLWWSWENAYFIFSSPSKSIGSMNHCIGLGHETMVCLVYRAIFLFKCHDQETTITQAHKLLPVIVLETVNFISCGDVWKSHMCWQHWSII